MRARAILPLAGLALLVGASDAHGDAISPAPDCPPGTSRGVGLAAQLAGGFYGHGGTPACEPAVCTVAAGCPRGQACRLDTHCIAHREERELRVVGHGRGPRLDPDNPASWATVARVYDLGRCDEGSCPEGARCLQVATCRPVREQDQSIVVRPPIPGRDPLYGAARAARAWTVAVPVEGTPVEATSVEATPTPVEGSPTPAEATRVERASPVSQGPAPPRAEASTQPVPPAGPAAQSGCASAPPGGVGGSAGLFVMLFLALALRTSRF